MPRVASHALLFVSCWTLCWSAAPQTSTWRIKTKQGVIEYDTVTSVSSDMMCVRECGQRPPCESCAYDRVSGTCYLQVDSGALTAKSTDTVTHFSGLSPSPSFSFSFSFTFTFSSRWHRSARKGPYTLRPVSQQSPQGCPRNSVNICLVEHKSFWPLRVDCRPLPFSTPLSFRWSFRIPSLLPPSWPSGQASAWRAEDPGFEFRLRRDFFGVESYQ